MNFRERRELRKQLREDIFDLAKAGATEDEIKEELKEKYAAIDWATLLKLITELLPIILALFKKT